MPTLQTGSGALRINVPRGSTLIIRNQSGVETVTGSSAAREDATFALGANAVVYGPQSASSDVSITTTGVLTYDIVSGDATPATDDVRVSRNAATGAPSGLVDATGQPVGGGGVGSLSAPMFRGFTPANTAALKAFAQSLRNGSNRRRIVAMGSSVVEGNQIADTLQAWPRVLGELLRTIGPVNNTARCGYGQFAPDARITFFGSTTRSGSTLGGFYTQATATASGYQYTPGISFDALTVTAAGIAGGGTFVVKVDGVTVSTVSTVGADSLIVSEITGLNGTSSSVVRLECTSVGSGCYVGMAVPRRADHSSGVEIYNVGKSGLTTTAMLATAQRWDYGGAWRDLFTTASGSNLFLVEPGTINDAVGGTPAVPLATSISNFTTNLTDAVARGAAITIIPANVADTGQNAQFVANATWNQYADSHIAVSLGLGVPVIDFRADGTYLANSSGMFDGFHPRASLYATQAQYVYQALLAASAS